MISKYCPRHGFIVVNETDELCPTCGELLDEKES